MQVQDQSVIDSYYTALLERDSKYTGIFYVGVVTTSVFCIATCRARKPKKENVLFYTSFSDAIKNGFRPCKICRPTENAQETPESVSQAIKLIRDNPKEKISDAQLRQYKINPEQIRRWFKKHHGITFHAYQRMYRINNAYKELKDGKTATETAYDSGYDSLSGFNYMYTKVLKRSPSQSNSSTVILINRLTTPLGPMIVCATDKGICLLEFTDRKMLETELTDLQKLLKATIILDENTHTKQIKRELSEYFKGTRTVFNVALDTPGSEFQKSVWAALGDVKYGETSTYKELAAQLGNNLASRAVARANGCNRVSIVVPCHRIIGSDGSLTGYGGGIPRKKWLLEMEDRALKGRLFSS